MEEHPIKQLRSVEQPTVIEVEMLLVDLTVLALVEELAE
jgi:hypothetical protein